MSAKVMVRRALTAALMLLGLMAAASPAALVVPNPGFEAPDPQQALPRDWQVGIGGGAQASGAARSR